MKVFSRCMLVLILVTVICGIGGYAYENETITPMYSSTTQLYVVPGEQNEASVRASNGGLNNDFMIIFTSSVVISEAQKQLGTSEDIAQYLTVKSPDNSNIVEITCTNPDQNTAKQYVDAVATTALKTTSIIPVESIQILTVGTVSDEAVKPDLMKNTYTIAAIGAGICFILELLFILIRGAFKKPKDNSDDELEYEKHYGKYAMLSQPAMAGYLEARNANLGLNGVHNNGIKDSSAESYDQKKYVQDDAVSGRDKEDLPAMHSDSNLGHKSRKLSAAEKFRYQTEQYETYGTIKPPYAAVKDNNNNNAEQEAVAPQAVSDANSFDDNQNLSTKNNVFGSDDVRKDAMNHNLDHDMDDVLDDEYEDDFDDELLYDPLADLPEDPLDAVEDTAEDAFVNKSSTEDTAEDEYDTEGTVENVAAKAVEDDAMQDVAVSAVDLEIRSEDSSDKRDSSDKIDRTDKADKIDTTDNISSIESTDVIHMNQLDKTTSGFHVIEEVSTVNEDDAETGYNESSIETEDATDTTVVTGVFGESEDMKSNDEVKETLDIEVTKTDVQNDLQNDTQNDNQKDAENNAKEKGSSPKILARIRK